MSFVDNPTQPNLAQCCQPLGGMFSNAVTFTAHPDEPRLVTTVVRVGNSSVAIKRFWGSSEERGIIGSLDGCGVGVDTDRSTLPAIAESLERYCASAYCEKQLLRATARELGIDCLDLDEVPRCSETELSNPRCPLMAPDKDSPIRWVRSISLLDGKIVYVPAAMIFLYAGYSHPGERFWLPITTGCAAHSSLERAILSAIHEVIERDAISIVWLQKLELPRINLDQIPPSMAQYWELYQKSSKGLEYVFFDATTDLGVPTVYGIQRSKYDKRLTTLVSCSTATSSVEALTKVMRDMVAGRIAFRVKRTFPRNYEDFSDIFHGASYMARQERQHAFDFLMNSRRVMNLSKMHSESEGDDSHALSKILNRFRENNTNIYAVELSTDEALRAGLRVVRVLIPALQPISFHHRARYLGHDRLYQVPKRMGYPTLEEHQLNEWPQPFA